MIKRALTTEDIKKFVECCGYEFVDTFKKDRKHMVTVVCPSGHKNTLRFNNFKTRKGSCKDCSRENIGKWNKKDFADVIEFFSEYGFSVLSVADEYKGNTSILKLKCPNGHPVEASVNNFKKIKTKCRECEGKIPLNINNIRIAFEERGYLLLSDNFIDVRTKMKYICLKHPDEIREVSFNNFQNGKGCKECGYEILRELKKTDYNKVKNDFIKKEYTLISKEYINNFQYLEFICDKHSELGVQLVTYGNLKATNHNCALCKEEHIKRGENHPFWNGGMSLLHDLLRKTIDEWKRESMEECGYRCVITGNNFDVIHHLYSFHNIASEVIETLGLDRQTTLESYSQSDIQNIRKTNLNLHYKYGLGVCLTNEIHDLFHRTYGKKNNTPKQFEEFKQRYKNGEFGNILNERSVL